MDETFREDLQNWHLAPKRITDITPVSKRWCPTSQNTLVDRSHHKHQFQTGHWRSSVAQEAACYIQDDEKQIHWFKFLTHDLFCWYVFYI
jgi:hypothetical protein